MKSMNAVVVVLCLAISSGCQEYSGNTDGGVTDQGDDCPAVCSGGCSTGTCIITDNNYEVVCPAGMACRVSCNQSDSCAGGVDCSRADSCDIRCLGSDSCTGDITCGGGSCHVECGGTGNTDMCLGDIDCTGSSYCEVGCLGSASCFGSIQCGPGRCVVQCGGTGSTSQCHGPISCSASCACDVVCVGGSSCTGAISCPRQCDTWLGCTSTETGCDSCN